MTQFNNLSNAVRFLAVDAVEKANSGHPGMPMGMADVATVLFRDFLRFDPANPSWADRDRFVLSAGHGSMLLYALAYLTGYKDMTLDQIKNFRQLKSLTPGHPERHLETGVEMTTGPLGQGLSTSVGMALAEEILKSRFGEKLVNHKTYVICSDGDLQEGVTHEACALAGHWKLKNLIVLYDSNDISIDGPTSLSFSENIEQRFLGYGWAVEIIDGHNESQIQNAIAMAQDADRPTMIVCKTKIGFGSPNKAGSKDVHGSPLGKDETAATRAHLSWVHEPFVIPQDILDAWRAIGKKGASHSKAWNERLTSNPQKKEFENFIALRLTEEFSAAIAALKKDFIAKKPAQATRKSSGDTLEKIVPELSFVIGGSADLTPSNNTRTSTMTDIKAGDFSGRYVRYGVREHGMACIMNGMALHGGIVPYSGTFMSFTDYCRPAIRLAALMKQRSIFVMTHDSIGLGEDGPTHQPVEHLAALRAIPNLQVLRPCDPIETAECWQMALEKSDAPSILALSRQNVPTARLEASDKNLSALGGYVLRAAENAKITLVATGTEISIAVSVHEKLAEKGIASQVVSMPCREIFLSQSLSYQAAVLGKGKRVVIEAGIKQGWEGIIGLDGHFFGVETFGESAPYLEIYKHFGLTSENIVQVIA
jgi:transketolase